MTATGNRDEPGNARARIVMALLAGLVGCDVDLEQPTPVEVPPSASGAHRPIVVVTIDTLRADHLGAYGYVRETSPNLDALAREAVLFDQAYSTAGTTLPAHVSLFTSLYPLQTGITSNGPAVAASGARVARLLQEELKMLGYDTGGFVSAAPVKARSGLDAAMDVWAEPARGVPQRPGSETTDLALAWLADRDGAPFYLWVHYFDPHSPHEAPEGYGELFASSDGLAEFQRDRGFPADRSPELTALNDAYDGEIRYADAELARLIDALRKGGWYEEATIIVASDHGEGLGQHGRLEHGRVYQEILRVPLIIKFPGRFELNGTRYADPVSLIDVVPTLVETLGLDVGSRFVTQFEGTNVFGSSARGRQLYAQRTFRSRPKAWGPGKKFVLFDGRWKLHDSTHVDNELYDLLVDPHELTNVIEEHPEVGDRMHTKLAELLGRFNEPGLRLNSGSDDIPDGFLDELRALGYIR